MPGARYVLFNPASFTILGIQRGVELNVGTAAESACDFSWAGLRGRLYNIVWCAPNIFIACSAAAVCLARLDSLCWRDQISNILIPRQHEKAGKKSSLFDL